MKVHLATYLNKYPLNDYIIVDFTLKLNALYFY